MSASAKEMADMHDKVAKVIMEGMDAKFDPENPDKIVDPIKAATLAVKFLKDNDITSSEDQGQYDDMADLAHRLKLAEG